MFLLLLQIGNEEEFISKTIKLVQNSKALELLKQGAALQSEKYSPEQAWSIIKDNI